MKSLLIILAITLSACVVHGQGIYSNEASEYRYYLALSKLDRKHIVSGKIDGLQIYCYKKDSTNVGLVAENKYDRKGNATEWIIYKHGKIKERDEATFDDSNRMISYIAYDRKGRQKIKGLNIYNQAGNLVENDQYGSDPKKPLSKMLCTYNSNNKITDYKWFGKNDKLKARTEYSYYDDGSNKQTIAYSGKGKVTNIWNYDCSPVGKLEAKKLKDTSKICIHYEKDKNGDPIEVEEQVVHAGGLFDPPTRYITKSDKKHNVLEQYGFEFSGKEIYHASYGYNNLGQMTEQLSYKAGTPDVDFKTVYMYNENNYITTMKVYRDNMLEPYSVIKYTYTLAK